MSMTDPIVFGQVLPSRLTGLPASERGLILIIANDDGLAEPMRLELESSGFTVHVARTKSEGLQASRSRDVAAIIVDRMGGGVEGLTIVEELRVAGDHTPLLAVGVPESVEERITYIRSGADDYLTRPFDLREMTARVEALLRRRRDERAAVLEVGAIEMDLVKRVVRCMGRRVDLLPREFTLLEYFARHPRQILSREKLLEDVWRSRAYGRTNVVDVQVGNLRRKLDPTGERRFIVSVRGAGFRLEPAGLD
ncbi:two-component system OmpR family response regulator [Roseiarcus fermentans]|uniref:Two-component system OmpR family response regulator n=1 Tax=Roseiarcus fermentans TaxID=1473586 RepID=A0A366EVM4_9HYPH|nr:response regulator transcription factor [Roseiarcus fermentans]RBP06437.1 two-component system OmpR family response regulator [Roseiarcus fermentans]